MKLTPFYVDLRYSNKTLFTKMLALHDHGLSPVVLPSLAIEFDAYPQNA